MHHVDSSVIRAHQHAAGAKDGNPEAEALGRSVGGFRAKIHLRIEGNGKPMTIRLTIPRRSNEYCRGKFDRAIYREHHRIERTINRLKQFRRVTTRY